MLKVVVIGYGEMFTNLIAAALDANCNIVGVLRKEMIKYPSWLRKMKDIINPSKDYNYIKSYNLPEIKGIDSVNSEKFRRKLIKLNPDIVLVGSWGEKFEKATYDIPKIATINAHPSLLPKYRGPNPYLKPESFYKPAHRYVYEAMLQLYNSEDRIDIVSVSDTLNINQKLELVGGRAFINDLSYKTITTTNVEYYAKIVQEKAIKRSLINAGSEIINSGYDLKPVEESLDEAEKLIYDIGSQKASKLMVQVKDLVYDTEC